MTDKPVILVWVPPPILRQVEGMLERLNRTCSAALSFDEAKRLLDLGPQILITVLNLEGFELLRTARTYHPRTKVVLMAP
jgi:hypothetical protein